MLHPKTLSNGSTINTSPGFSVEALKKIKTKAKYSKRQIICSLIMNEILIRQIIKFDGKKYYEYVDFGVGSDIAREALVFMYLSTIYRGLQETAYSC